jgi:hypothetical protein
VTDPVKVVAAAEEIPDETVTPEMPVDGGEFTPVTLLEVTADVLEDDEESPTVGVKGNETQG